MIVGSRNGSTILKLNLDVTNLTLLTFAIIAEIDCWNACEEETHIEVKNMFYRYRNAFSMFTGHI